MLGSLILCAPIIDIEGYNVANQLVHDGTHNLTYNDNGNLTSDGVNSYTWDRANRLLSVGSAAYQYDGVGHRIQKTVGVDVTKYLLDLQPGLSVVLSANKNGDVTRFVHTPMGIHAQEDQNGMWTWAAQDGLGSVRLEASNALSVLGMRHLDPFGNPFGAQGTITLPFVFTGEIRDENGLQDHRARQYSSQLGVFPSLDPFEGMMDRPMSLNGYSWVEGNVPNAVDPSGMCAMRTLQVEASDEETNSCKDHVWILQHTYNINLAVKSGSFDDNWTTTRVKNVIEAMRAIASRIGGVAPVRQAFGNTTLSAGAGGLVGCASTESGTNIDWGSCSTDDPYRVFNIIHEFGHVLKFRNDGYASGTPIQIWDRMLSATQPTPDKGLDYYTDKRSAFFPIHAGFATTARQNLGEGGRSHDEEIADMFLFWIVPGLSFDDSPAGVLRQLFVDGFETDDFQGTGIAVTNIGMSGWIARAAAQAGGGNGQVSVSPTLVSLIGIIPNGECLDLPFMNTQVLV